MAFPDEIQDLCQLAATYQFKGCSCLGLLFEKQFDLIKFAAFSIAAAGRSRAAFIILFLQRCFCFCSFVSFLDQSRQASDSGKNIRLNNVYISNKC